MYGLSRQVAFATRLGIVDNAAGQQLMADLEKDLNQLYSEVYEEQNLLKSARRHNLARKS